MKDIISKLVIFCHILTISNLYAFTDNQKMNILRFKGTALIANKGSNNNVVKNAYYEIIQLIDGQKVIIGFAETKIIRKNKCGLRLIELKPGRKIQKGDLLRLIESENESIFQAMDMQNSQLKEFKNVSPDNNQYISPSNKQLNSIQEREFKRNRLSIELMDVGISSYDPDLRLGIYESWKKWQAYKGFSPISEHTFFRLTGFEKEAEQAADYRNSSKTLIIIGFLFGLGGAIMMYSGYNKTRTDYVGYMPIVISDPDYEMIRLGGVVSGIGSSLIIAGSLKLKKNWAAYATVKDIASEYNRELRLSIKRKW